MGFAAALFAVACLGDFPAAFFAPGFFAVDFFAAFFAAVFFAALFFAAAFFAGAFFAGAFFALFFEVVLVRALPLACAVFLDFCFAFEPAFDPAFASAFDFAFAFLRFFTLASPRLLDRDFVPCANAVYAAPLDVGHVGTTDASAATPREAIAQRRDRRVRARVRAD